LPVRLWLVAALAALEHDAKVDFSYLKNLLKLTDGNLGGPPAEIGGGGLSHAGENICGSQTTDVYPPDAGGASGI
jgi:hypothetical protein